MPIVGFSFSKVLAEKKESLKADTKINNNISILNVAEEKNPSLTNSGGLVVFSFEYTVVYGNSAKIQLDGNILFMGESANTKKILDTWKKDKTIDASVSTQVF